MSHIIHLLNHEMLLLENVINAMDGVAITTATTFEVTLEDDHGNAVTGETWPLTLTHLGGTAKPGGGLWDDGTWAAVFNRTLNLVKGGYYYGIIDLAAAGDQDAHWEIELEAAIRRATLP
jgi:hypothetical protein